MDIYFYFSILTLSILTLELKQEAEKKLVSLMFGQAYRPNTNDACVGGALFYNPDTDFGSPPRPFPLVQVIETFRQGRVRGDETRCLIACAYVNSYISPYILLPRPLELYQIAPAMIFPIAQNVIPLMNHVPKRDHPSLTRPISQHPPLQQGKIPRTGFPKLLIKV
jgi:hypothetical protein